MDLQKKDGAYVFVRLYAIGDVKDFEGDLYLRMSRMLSSKKKNAMGNRYRKHFPSFCVLSV
jgi:hypothetical protein